MIAAAELIASGHALDTRAADPLRDGVDGIVPGVIVTPRTAAAVAATLRWASTQRLSVVIRGQGSKDGWGAGAGPIDVLVEMSALNRILTHQAGDLTVTVEAGIRLHDLNQQLAPHRQWLALDPPWPERATIGGLLATNDSGPQRHRFGTPRDLVIGIQLATTDGALSKAGGQVVKNVAGYDLSKLISGSFGSLAAIVSATFKLAPMPAASATVVIDRLSVESLGAVIDAVSASQLEPVAFEVGVRHPAGVSTTTAPDITCLLRFASFPRVVDAEVANASARVASFHQSLQVVAGESEREVWTAHARRLWEPPGTIIRAAWRPADMQRALSTLVETCGVAGFELTGRLGVGAGHVRLDGDGASHRTAIDRLRCSDVLGNIVVVRAPAELRTPELVWGPRRNEPLTSALKRELDPAGVLGAGRGPL
jgi:glycolate oxidase FAD binding subunit